MAAVTEVGLPRGVCVPWGVGGSSVRGMWQSAQCVKPATYSAPQLGQYNARLPGVRLHLTGLHLSCERGDSFWQTHSASLLEMLVRELHRFAHKGPTAINTYPSRPRTSTAWPQKRKGSAHAMLSSETWSGFPRDFWMRSSNSVVQDASVP